MLLHTLHRPNCDKELRSAAGVEEGRKIKCPGCQESFAVAAPADGQEERPKAARTRGVQAGTGAARGKAARPPADEDEDDAPRRKRREDDEDEDEPRPRSKKGKNPAKASKLPVQLAVVGGAVLLLGLVLGGCWWFVWRHPASSGGGSGDTSASGTEKKPHQLTQAEKDALRNRVIDGVTYKPGLVAEYFPNEQLKDAVSTKIDDKVAFNWGFGAPPGLPNDHFSARWEGWLITGSDMTVTFYLYADDGARLYIDHKLVLDCWTKLGKHYVQVPLTRRPQHLVIEFREGEGTALMEFGWQNFGSHSDEAVPADWLFHDDSQLKTGKPPSTGPGTPDASGGADRSALPRVEREADLRQLAFAYSFFFDANKRSPANAEELSPYFEKNQKLLKALNDKEVVLIFNAPPITQIAATDGTSNVVLAYEGQTPTKGGYVVMFDTSVHMMTADEFKKAKLAGAK